MTELVECVGVERKEKKIEKKAKDSLYKKAKINQFVCE